MILLWDVLHAIIKHYLEKSVPHVVACSVISALWRPRREDSEFKASLGYTARAYVLYHQHLRVHSKQH